MGLVSFLTDVRSEMIFSVFAIFFTTVAGAVSDQTGKRKPFALSGYGFSTAAKIILSITTSVASLALFRVIERLGKSFRGPPRDAWFSAIAAKNTRGYSFGVQKALDKAGAMPVH